MLNYLSNTPLVQGFAVSHSKHGELNAFKYGINIYMSLTNQTLSQLSPDTQNMYSAKTGAEYGNVVKSVMPEYWFGLKFYPNEPTFWSPFCGLLCVISNY